MSKQLRHPAAGLAILLCVALGGLAHAEEHPYYGGFALGFAEAGSNCGDCSDDDTAFKFYGGKQLGDNFGLEISYHDLGILRNNGRPGSTSADSHGVNLSLMGIIPTGDVGFLYGRVGVMAWEADYTESKSNRRSSDDGTDLTYGLGYALTFGPNYDFRFEFERLNELGDEFESGGSAVSVFYLGGTIYFD